MKVFHGLCDPSELAGAALCLGNFDGVHKGHQALFRKAAEQGRPAAMTFQPHPGKVLQPELAPKLITLLPRKLELIAGLGVEVTVILPFTTEYARTSAERFESMLLDQLKLLHLVVGTDFTYGEGRRGTVETMRVASSARGAKLHTVPPVAVDGVVVSSTKVREYILEGRVAAAQRLLGRWFDLDGTVVTGKGRGRQIGFPTANVDTSNELRPAPGVYAVRVRIQDAPKAAWLPGAANIGVKPTFGGDEVTIEVHLIDFEGELYGRPLRVQFIDRLRPERRFASAAELAGQIRRDVEAASAVAARAAD